MTLKLHHVNFCSKDVPEMDDFYRNVLGLEPEPSLSSARVTAQGYAGNVAFVTDLLAVFALGFFSATRLEMFLRAKQMLRAHLAEMFG